MQKRKRKGGGRKQKERTVSLLDSRDGRKALRLWQIRGGFGADVGLEIPTEAESSSGSENEALPSDSMPDQGKTDGDSAFAAWEKDLQETRPEAGSKVAHIDLQLQATQI